MKGFELGINILDLHVNEIYPGYSENGLKRESRERISTT